MTAPTSTTETRSGTVQAAVESATRRVAPLWPLKHFVAVNPFLGLSDQPFSGAAHRLGEVAGARMTLPRREYAEAIRSGRIRDVHLARALERAHEDAAGDARHRDQLPPDVATLRATVLGGDDAQAQAPRALPTATDVVGELTGRDWSRFVAERISLWAGAYTDQGQASWASPWRAEAPWAAWLAESRIDRTPEVMGLTGFRAFVATLPHDPAQALEALLDELGIPGHALELYLHRLLMSVGGWAAWFAYERWEAELYEGTDDGIVHLLAIRAAWEVALIRAFQASGAREEWADAAEELGTPPDLSAAEGGLQLDLVLHEAWEMAWQDEMVRRFDEVAEAGGEAEGAADTVRPDVQAAFCIDVRSEVYRRALEAQSEGIETLGFAGFFGFPIEYVPVGEARGGAQCPVLLTPAAAVAETVAGDARATQEVGRLKKLRRQATAVWKSFKMGAVSCFGFVGPVGLAYAWKLATDTLGLSRPVPHPDTDGIGSGARERLGPSLDPVVVEGRTLGLTPEARLETAEGVLRAMSLTEGFARLVVLAGHGSTTVNNPHATGLDCGACGGHTGEANARVAAAVLNDPQVRAGLAQRGIHIPVDTLFVGALHDTTTDEVVLYEGQGGGAGTHADDLRRLRGHLAEAGRVARAERAPALKVARGPGLDDQVRSRTRDWSQVRPEWGLAGCAAFVVAPRERTARLDLGGRSFLHSYAWEQDQDFSVLELIMTAPMVVTSWISLQYFGSTVDNRVFGSGNKVLHNVVGALGVLEGNGGDLRTGLPWQSVHDGERYIHEPLRLNVVIEAPIEAMNGIIERHPGVRDLLDHGWLNLWRMDAQGRIADRYLGELTWGEVPRPGRDREDAEQAA